MHSYNIIESGKSLSKAKKALILLHGRGATAHDILGLAHEFVDDSFYIVAPQATNNTWYPNSFMADEQANEPWLSSAVAIVKRLIDETSRQISNENIYLMGFSQGACLTLEVAAQYANKYAGIAAFTGGLIGKELNTSKYKGDFEGTKIFIGNGDKDFHVPLLRCEKSKTILEKMGADVDLKIYPNRPHTILSEEVKTVKELMF